MTIRIVSFNLLVPIYADPECYVKCQPQFLNTNYRWNLIQSQLRREMLRHGNTIICLQEICLTLLPQLDLFFRQQNYTFFHNLYGNQRNDYIGVGIAIPLSMGLSSVHYIKVGDYLHRVTGPLKSKRAFSQGHKVADHSPWHPASNLPDPWQMAMDKSNTLVCLEVAIGGKSLFVGTYHMPCLYARPDVMMIHASVVKDLMFQLAAGRDLILAGDFNIKPSDDSYRALIERGYLNGRFPRSTMYRVAYRPNAAQSLRSAYLEKNGVEPAYTTYVDTLRSPNFCATLDYIFFAGHLMVEEVLKLPAHPRSPSYPDETHPSDHLMIAASFRFS